MKSLYFLWYYLNWLELVTYVLIPTAMVLIILTYIFFNIELIRLTFNFDVDLAYRFEKLREKRKKINELDEARELKEKLKKIRESKEKSNKKNNENIFVE